MVKVIFVLRVPVKKRAFIRESRMDSEAP